MFEKQFANSIFFAKIQIQTFKNERLKKLGIGIKLKFMSLTTTKRKGGHIRWGNVEDKAGGG